MGAELSGYVSVTDGLMGSSGWEDSDMGYENLYDSS